MTSLGPSPQSSTPCQQTFPCCTACLVWLVLGAREMSLWVNIVPREVPRDKIHQDTPSAFPHIASIHNMQLTLQIQNKKITLYNTKYTIHNTQYTVHNTAIWFSDMWQGKLVARTTAEGGQLLHMIVGGALLWLQLLHNKQLLHQYL